MIVSLHHINLAKLYRNVVDNSCDDPLSRKWQDFERGQGRDHLRSEFHIMVCRRSHSILRHYYPVVYAPFHSDDRP